MSIQSIVRSSLIVSSILVSSATVFARQPPALTNTGTAPCENVHAVGGAGYRDAATRFASHTAASSARSASEQSGGYRDAHARLGLSRSTTNVACTTPAPVAMRTARR